MALTTNDWTGLTVSDGRYSITSILGAGGMGIVYRARDSRLDADVVIKVPRQAMLLDPEFAGRFAREIRSLVTLSHPNIVKVTDVGQHHGLPFAVLQYLPGGSLEDRQRASGDGKTPALDPKGIPGWLRGVAEALDYIHSKGYVHRDVKPGNILFDDEGHAFLGDFGVIKALAAEEPTHSKTATGAGLVLGTPEYMAPELIMAGDVDGRVDQYALAVTVYEMLCGRRPFEGSSPTAVLVLQTTQPPVSPSELRSAVPRQISEAVLRGLSKDAASRYPSCAAFAVAVIAAIEASQAEAAAPAASATGSQPVKILCAECGKTISMAVATFANLKRTGRSFACPRCQAAVQVSSEKTRIVGSLPTVEGSFTPRSTQKIAPTATQKINSGRTQKVAPAGTQKIATPDTPPLESTAGRASTLKIDALNVVTSQENRPSRAVPNGPAKPWLVPALAAAAVVLAIAGVFVFRTGGPDAAEPVPIAANQAKMIAQSSQPRTDSRPHSEAAPLLREDAPGTDRVSTASPPSRTPAPDYAPPPNIGTDPSPSFASASRPARPAVEDASTAGPRTATLFPRNPAEGTSSDTSDGSSSSRLVPSQPPPNTGEAMPVGRGPSLTKDQKPAKVDIDTLLAAPQGFADQEISPSGLYLVGSSAIDKPNGGTTLAVIQSEMNVQRDGSLPPRTLGKTHEIEVEKGMLDRLIAKRIVWSGTLASSQWGKNLAILTLRVSKGARYDANGWICRIIKAEFLLNVDYARIYDRKYGRSFQTFTIGTDEEKGGIGDGDDWSTRLGQHALVSIGKVYKTFKNQQLQAISARNNAIMGAMIGEAMREAEAAAAADEAMRRRAMNGGKVVDGLSAYEQQAEINRRLSRP